MRLHYKILILLILSSYACQSQGLKVLITEEKKGKRVQLFAENKTADTLNVLLTVNGEGYRRSALKPVVKDIPPYDKVEMITLIELADVPSQYTFDMMINEKGTINAEEYNDKERDIERVILDKLVLFTVADCERCEALITALEEKRIALRTFDIHEDKKIFAQFMSYIERDLTVDTKIAYPIIWNRDRVIFGYDSLNVMVEILSDQGN